MTEDTGWTCRNCGNFNVRTNSCYRCGEDKDFNPSQSQQSESTTSVKSKVDEYWAKAVGSFGDSMNESDESTRSRHLTRAQGYLTMAYEAAGDDVEERKGIGGLMALILTNLDDFKNAEAWASEELSINPINVFAKLATYFIELDKLVHHKGYIAPDTGGVAGSVFSLLTVGVDAGRVSGKKNAVKTAGIDAARAIEDAAQSDPEPNSAYWILWSLILLSIIENMWANNMKEPYLCDVLLNLPWNRCPEEEIAEFQDVIEEIQVEAHGYMGRLR